MATGKGGDAITSGLEGAWTTAPAQWDNNFFENLFGYEWELEKGAGGAYQWTPEGCLGGRYGAGCSRSVGDGTRP